MKVSTSRKSLPHKSIAYALLLGVILLSLVFFDAYIYDVLAYHGPFSAIAYRIPLLGDFKLEKLLLNRYQGFASLWRVALYPSLLFDIPRLMILPNILSLSACCYVFVRLKILPLNYVACSIFAFPVCLFAFRSGYQDFFVGSTVAAALVLLLSSVYDKKYRELIFAVFLLLLASNIKYQGYIQSVVALMVSMISLFCANSLKKHDGKVDRNVIIICIFSLFLVSSHSIYNLLSYSNPFYPIQVGPFEGPEGNYTSSSTYTSFFYPLHGLLNHFFSSTEIDWLFRGVVPNYSIDMARSQTQFGGILDPRSTIGAVRSGGSYGPAYCFMLIVYLSGLYQKLRSFIHGQSLNRIDFIYVNVGLYLLFSSFLPQSHELRYYLSSLILIASMSLNYLLSSSLDVIARFAVLLFASTSVFLNFVQPLHSTLKEGIGYAIDYPSRDLPSYEVCIQSANVQDPAKRFACKLVKRREIVHNLPSDF